jgi:hypothetical protein
MERRETVKTDYAVTLQELAPCGLDCARCFGYAGGEIKALAAALLDRLGNFEPVASRLCGVVPALQDYARFQELLNMMAAASCPGCRAGGGRFPPCAAKTCFREQGVDFCYQCAEYPCERNQFDPDLLRRWRWMNDRMAKIGVEAYYHEQKKKPRY